MKKKQLPNTSSRRGFARMAEDMKKKSSEPSSITRVMIWKKAHMKKDGNPVNSEAAKTLELIEKVGESLDNSLTNVTDDALSKVLGPDRSHVKGLGFGVTRSKLSMLSQKESRYTAIEDECHKLRSDVTEMKSIISSLLRNQGQTSDQNSNATESQPTVAQRNNPIMPCPLSGTNTSKKCKLVDWSGSGEVVAEGRWSSNDPTVLVHHVPLGPHAYRVWVDVVKIHDAFLWRPSSDMSTMEEAIGTTIAWPADKVIMG